MAIRFAAPSAMALAAALLLTPAAHAQGFYSFYGMSPRQIVGMLDDDGYQLRGPLMRRGDVYVCDVVSVTGRSARLIVDARDGHVIERFASVPRERRFGDEPNRMRPPRDIGDNGPRRSADDDDSTSSRQTAMGGGFHPLPHFNGGDALFGMQPTPTPQAAGRAKPKHHATRRHKEPAVAKGSGAKDSVAKDSGAKGAAATVDAKASDKPTDTSSSVAAVAPSAGVTPAKPEATPKPAPSAAREQAKADSDKRVVAAPKPAAAHKKLNDLPVGTLD